MGYSVTVQVSDKKLRAKALAFMQKQFRRWVELHKDFMESNSLRGPLSGPDLSYDRKVTRIGFDYSCLPDLERHYVWCILNWMALTFGDRCKFHGSKDKYPFYIYDGNERSPVLAGDDWENCPESVRDGERERQPDGWFNWLYADNPRQYKHWLAIIKDYGVSVESCEKAIRKELVRLTNEWQKENDHGKTSVHHRYSDIRVGNG